MSCNYHSQLETNFATHKMTGYETAEAGSSMRIELNLIDPPVDIIKDASSPAALSHQNDVCGAFHLTGLSGSVLFR